MTQNDSAVESSSQRRWLYGFNVFLLVLIGAVIIGAVLFLTNRFKTKWDCTSSKLYSLSSYTQKLLKQVDEKGQKFELISLYTGGGIGGSENAQKVDDLLQEYARTSKNVMVEDLSSSSDETLQDKIRKRYTSELEPYETTVKGFSKLADDLDKFAKIQAANLSGLSQSPTASPAEKQQILEVQGFFQSVIPEFMSPLKRAVAREQDSTSPNWTRLTTALKTSLDDAEKQLALMANPAQAKEAFSSPTLVAYLAKAGDTYKAIDKELKDYIDQLNKLKPLKVQDILDAVHRDTVIVLAPDSATVIPDYSIFKDSPASQGAPQTPPSFEGEQAVSSALLSIIQPEKVKVVFITTSPTHPATNTNDDGWSDVADRLREANFDVQEWSPPGAPQPGMPPESATPPAEGKGVVWIVFPPDAPNQQQMMMGMPPPSPQPVIDAVKKHLQEGGQALFLAESASASPMGGGADYPFSDLLQDMGIDVQSKYILVHNRAGPDGQPSIFPGIEISRYGDNDITKPLQSLKSIFVAFPQSRMGGITGGIPIVGLGKKMPADVDAQIMIEAPRDADTWAESNFTPDAKFDPASDQSSPFPIAALAVKGKGKDNEQRVVVIGSRMLGINYLERMRTMRQDAGSGTVTINLEYPGNAELVNNSVLWLAGYKNMISVSAKSAAALRIRDISPAILTFWRWMLFAGIPALALVLGGIMYLFRRR